MRKYFLLILSFLFVGCSLFSENTETIFSVENNSLDHDFYEVSVCTGDLVDEFFMQNNQNTFILDLPKNVVVGVLVYPIKNGRRLLPLGAIYPFETLVTKKNGYAAYIADRLYRSSTDRPNQVQDFVSRFNWKKFIQTVEGFENPWFLDTDRIVKAIAAGNLKKTDFKIVGK